ncbi:MAG: TIGR02452 family protein [Ruminococcus sp.]|nr:TIGR02452 family protein [Ruminococcus sp.]MDE6847766.1 TIGR02452 family protein [Ruminococcus sp.]
MLNNIKIKSDNDHIFKNGDFQGMISETVFSVSEIPEIKRERYFSVAENTVKSTTVRSIIERAGHGNITALNFANAMYAGGAYVLGGNAQEESLCRASMLYYTIRNQKDYYCRNRIHVFPDYTDVIIYSANVPVIRNDNGVLLEKPVLCSFITSPAVNRTFAKFIFSQKKINDIMYTRIKKIIMLALEKKTDILILGAFGCGMFGNERETVFPMFEEIINKYVPDSVEVIFAVP